MVNITNDYLLVSIVIVLSSLITWSFCELINHVLPGDQEMLATLKHIRMMKADTHQKSRQIIDDLAEVSTQNGQIHTGGDTKE